MQRNWLRHEKRNQCLRIDTTTTPGIRIGRRVLRFGCVSFDDRPVHGRLNDTLSAGLTNLHRRTLCRGALRLVVATKRQYASASNAEIAQAILGWTLPPYSSILSHLKRDFGRRVEDVHSPVPDLCRIVSIKTPGKISFLLFITLSSRAPEIRLCSS